ncbi:MAG: hypothetical protein WD096_02840, partial [Actinomycetota bacterium]
LAASGPPTLPFCSLPDRTRGLIAAGFRDGRSPEVLGVAGEIPIVGGEPSRDETPTPWPSTTSDVRVPIVFVGSGVRPGSVPDGSGLSQIAPTIAEVIGLRPRFPDVRSGRAIAGIASGSSPRLVVEVALEGLGTGDLEAEPTAWPTLRGLLEEGAGTTLGTTGSLPLDPTAVLTTIGTGGLPSEHGITGTLLRNETGALTSAWGAGAPLPVISTLAEDLDDSMGEQPLVGLVAPGRADRGIVGGAWYLEHDRDLVARAPSPSEAARLAATLLERGFGGDGVPDVLAVVMQGDVAAMDAALRRLIVEAGRASGGSVVFVVAGTGSWAVGGSVDGTSVGDRVEEIAGPVVEAVVPGGIYVDLPGLLSVGASREIVRGALAGARDPQGSPLIVDAFHSYAVSLARYC